jgi:hypothetical protein
MAGCSAFHRQALLLVGARRSAHKGYTASCIPYGREGLLELTFIQIPHVT